MKKHLNLLAIFSMAGLAACTSKPEGGLSAVAEKNLESQRAVAKCFETKDFSKLGDYIAADAVDHAGPNGDIKGLDSIKAAMVMDMAMMNDMKAEPVKEMADSDYVMSWYRFTGTYKNTEMGHKAGESFDMTAMEVSRFKDGKTVEHWTFMDPKDVMKMMGGMAPPPSKDSTKKM